MGKENVKMKDIKRLGMVNRWREAKCNYCNGSGRVNKNILNTTGITD